MTRTERILLEQNERLMRMVGQLSADITVIKKELRISTNRVLKTREAAEMLGITVQALNGRVARGSIPYFKSFGRRVFRESDIRKFNHLIEEI